MHPEGIHPKLLKPSLSPTPNEVLIISADSAFQKLLDNSAAFLDNRPAEEWQIDHIPSAMSLELMKYYTGETQLDSLQKEQTYILYTFDDSATDAAILAGEMLSSGFSDVHILYGGFAAWLERGYPLETPEGNLP
ncbi:MAG: rhodanese-like domain-containing protein [Calditrichia bacterium]